MEGLGQQCWERPTDWRRIDALLYFKIEFKVFEIESKTCRKKRDSTKRNKLESHNRIKKWKTQIERTKWNKHEESKKTVK